MDLVITFVNGTDPLWVQDYERALGKLTQEKRYRDWGLLKYWFRCVERHLPFVENVHLVVWGESQVPSWVDREKVHVVPHRDIIPAEFLPAFNSNVIEMFLPRIPGLAEEFVYFNDDIFPVLDGSKRDFFEDGRTVLGFSRHLLAGSLYKRCCKNCDGLARGIALARQVSEGGRPARPTVRGARFFRRPLCFHRPQHTCIPFYKSDCEEVLNAAEREISESITLLRHPKNLSHFLYSDYLYYRGKASGRRQSNKHFSLAASSAPRIAAWLASPDRKFVCINDVAMSDEKFLHTRDILTAAFEKRYPEKSKFEN